MKVQEHLTEDQVAQFAEALNSKKEAELPGEWKKHVAECDQCAFAVIVVSGLIEKTALQHSKSAHLTLADLLKEKSD